MYIVDNEKTNYWHVASRNKDGSQFTRSLKIMKVPPRTPPEKEADAKVASRARADEALAKLKQNRNGDLEPEELEEALHNIAALSTRHACTVLTFVFLIKWAWRYSFSHALDPAVVCRVCTTIAESRNQ
jgi:hypothetical protein